MHRRKLALAAISSVVAAAPLALATPRTSAATVESLAPTAARAAAVVEALSRASLKHPAAFGTTPRVRLPASGHDPAAVTLTDGSVATIGLPLGDATVRSLSPTMALLADQRSDTTIAVQPLATTGVRIAVVAESPRSPEDFRFQFGSAGGSALKLEPSGGVSVSSPSGGDLGYIAPPWAQDAAGHAVATYFTVEGSTLVQHVSHHGAVAYPVVADPSYQGDCGYVSCTLRFNRARTRDARDASLLIGLSATACGFLTGPAAPACAVAIGLQAGAIAVFANRFYEQGDCLKLKLPLSDLFSPVPVAIPQSLDHGSYNCTDK